MDKFEIPVDDDRSISEITEETSTLNSTLEISKEKPTTISGIMKKIPKKGDPKDIDFQEESDITDEDDE
jgi:hypothetical protein